MDTTLVILGRQPALGLAELESLYGAANVQPVGIEAALVSAKVDFNRLGGAIKLGRVIETVEASDWRKLERPLAQAIGTITSKMPEGKVQLGLSIYGWVVTPQQIIASGLSLKKSLRKVGLSARLVPNKTLALNSAQVLHNHLTGPTGCELLIVKTDDKTIIAQTTHVQDIDAYTLRDRGRPKRDPRVGMLPPKLAQIIANLAIAGKDLHKVTLLDPFCGTGVVLQETALMHGPAVCGSDLQERMVRYTRDNLNWLQDTFHLGFLWHLQTGDATTLTWEPTFNTVACETYLGRPFTSLPTPEILAQTVSECNTIIKKFLSNIYPQLQPGTRLCLAVPAWYIKPREFKHLPLIDQISEMGYNRVSFEHVRDEQLLYYREDQIVARELLVITRK